MGIDVHSVDLLNGSQTSRQDRLLLGLRNAVATPASANAVTGLGSITAGTGFTNINTVTLAPTGGTGSGLVAVPTALKAISATVVGGGTSGFAAADTITLSNGVVLTVATANVGGQVLTANVTTAGSFTGQVATNPVSQTATNGSGVGTTAWTLAYGLASAQILDSGSYTGAPSLTVTDSAGGTGASIATVSLGGNGNTIYKQINFDLPSTYAVLATPAMDCRVNVPAALKTNTGFSVALVPSTTGSTIAAGSIDVAVFA